MASRHKGAASTRRSRSSRSQEVEWISHYDLTPKEAAKQVGQTVVAEMKKQIGAGIDANGEPFKPYTLRYARRKAQMGGQVSPPDLKLTGRFLRALRAYGARALGTARAYVPIRVTRSKRAQGRGLFGWGFDWLGLAPHGRRRVAGEIARKPKGLFTSRPGKPRR